MKPRSSSTLVFSRPIFVGVGLAADGDEELFGFEIFLLAVGEGER